MFFQWLFLPLLVLLYFFFVAGSLTVRDICLFRVIFDIWFIQLCNSLLDFLPLVAQDCFFVIDRLNDFLSSV